MSATEGTTTAVTEKLTLTKEARDKLIGLFVEGPRIKVRRFTGLLSYHGWTVDQVIAAIHEACDREGQPLVIDSKAKATMNRSMAVVKPWVTLKVNDLVTEEDDTRDAVVEYLSQIADVIPGALEKYLVDEAEREDPKVKEYEEILVSPIPGAKVQFTPYAVDVPHGTGEKAIPGIIAEFLTHRLKDETGDIAVDWLRRYRNAVVYANNEKRRAAQSHDSIAADSRVGGVAGGAGPSGPEESTVTKVEGTPDQRLAGDKAVRELSTHELIVALTKRIVDYSQPITPVDAKAWDEMTGHYDTRFDHVPLGRTAEQHAVALAQPAAGAPWPEGLAVTAPAATSGEVGLTAAPVDPAVAAVLSVLTPEMVLALFAQPVAA